MWEFCGNCPFSVNRLFFWPKSQYHSKIHSDIKIHWSTFGFVGSVSNSQYIATNVAIVPINLQLHAISTIYVSQKCSKRVTSKRFNALHIISTFQNMLFMPANSNLHFCCYNYDVLYGQQWIKYLWSFLKIYVLFSFSNLWVQLSWWPWWYFYAYNSCLLFIMQR